MSDYSIGVSDYIAQFSNVSKAFGSVNVIDELNLNIKRGEFLTLLGPSGSGKSTTLMMLAGFEAATKGHILYSGRDVTHIPSYRRNLGVVFQDYALFPHMSVEQNIAFPLKMRKSYNTAQINEAVTSVLNITHMQEFRKRRPRELSGGQRQRVALARAMVFRPDMILLDEPLGALDLKLRQKIQVELRAIQRESGMTFVFVTHDQHEAMMMSDRIAVFNRGKIQQLDTPRNLYERPSNSFVAGFIGENNLLNGKAVQDAEGHTFLQIADFQVFTQNVSNINTGRQMTLSLRPESIRLVKPQTGITDGYICEAIYLGDHARVSARLCDGQIIQCRMLRSEHLPAQGDVVGLRWDETDVLVFSKETL